MSSSAIKTDVKYGDMKLAEQLIKQKIEASRKVINDVEQLKINELRTQIEKRLNVDARKSAINKKRLDVSKKIDSAQQKYQAIVNKAKEALEKEKSELNQEVAKLDALVIDITQEVTVAIAEEGQAIQRKAAEYRARLDSEATKLNDSIYEAVLPDNLRAIVASAPSIQTMESQVALEFSGKKK